MTAPWCVELKENILLVVENLSLVVVGNDDGDGTILVLRNGLRLDGRLDLAGNKVINELGDASKVDLLGLVIGVLGVLANVLDSEGGPLANLKVQVTTVLAESLSINGSEVDDTLVLLSEGLELLGEAGALLLGLSEDVGERDTGLKRSN